MTAAPMAGAGLAGGPSQLLQLQRAIGNRTLGRMLSGSAAPIQRKGNSTGMPDRLKDGLEAQSGMDLSDVKVHYNSDKPASLGALAYAQGSDIHVAPGQEKHLPHEGWHVVQQRQGRVKPSGMLEGGEPLNDDPSLEREADTMGERALQMKTDPASAMPEDGGS